MIGCCSVVETLFGRAFQAGSASPVPISERDKLFDILSCGIVRKNACHDRAYDRPSLTWTCVTGNGGVCSSDDNVLPRIRRSPTRVETGDCKQQKRSRG